jgi:D-sedoheptulose 7-phosphate isomerase
MKNAYLEYLQKALESIPEEAFQEAVRKLLEANESGKSIYVFGNGGSAATASHFASDLRNSKVPGNNKRFRVLCLCDNMSILTQIANDMSYEDVFTEQLKNLLQEGDICIAISASGNSPNVTGAVEFAKEKGGYIIGMTGFNGGRLKELSNLTLHAEGENFGVVEDAHLILEHMISQEIRTTEHK